MDRTIWWPSLQWSKRVGVSSSTRRMASLGGTLRGPNATTLGDLRKFVASLDRWPDRAEVEKADGAVLHVEYFETADSLLSTKEPTA